MGYANRVEIVCHVLPMMCHYSVFCVAMLPYRSRLVRLDCVSYAILAFAQRCPHEACLIVHMLQNIIVEYDGID